MKAWENKNREGISHRLFFFNPTENLDILGSIVKKYNETFSFGLGDILLKASVLFEDFMYSIIK